MQALMSIHLWEGIDWGKMFLPGTPILEIFIRGSLIYLGIFVLFRIIMKRQVGSMTLSDLLILVLVADAAQNGMADDYKSVTDGLLLVATLVFWHAAVDWVGYRVPAIGKLIHPRPIPLIKDGKLLHENLHREMITREELMTALRQQGVESADKVKQASLEANGAISIVPKS